MITPHEIFPWNVNFETGVEKIDAQHQTLVALVNKLAIHLAYESDRLTLDQVLDELTNYTIYHFKTEEAIWQKYFPADKMTAEHQQTHREFIDKVGEFRAAHELSAGEEMIVEILSFLTHWLAFHILDSDRHMAEMILAVQRGLTIEAAKEHANQKMSGAMHLLIETILKMYDTLSSRTLQLIREISQRQRIEKKLLLSKNVIDSTLEAIFITDEAGLIIEANPSFCSDVNREYGQLIGQDIRQIKASLFNNSKTADVWEAATKHGHWKGEIISIAANGKTEAAWLTLSAVKGNEGEVTHFAGVLSSISQLIDRQHDLEIEANHDELTGLPNRRLLNDRLGQAMMRSDRSNRMLAVCYLDLDGFKAVNDQFGHDAGDKLLCSVSQRLSNILRGEDTVARLGGDEFALLLGSLVSVSDAGVILNKVLDNIAKPTLFDGQQLKVSASIGVAIYPSDVLQPKELLKRADKAMYDAKKAGKSQFRVWSPCD